MEQITKRQLKILECIRERKTANNQEIQKCLKDLFGDISRTTVVRDINRLLEENLIEKKGEGRSVRYEELVKNELLSYFDTDKYFENGPDERSVAFERFNFDIFKNLKDIFTLEEISELKELNDAYNARIKKMPASAIKKEFERITIELSWKSSHIEGNTYSLIDTEILIKNREEAQGHKREEAVMILNHKKALEYILGERKDFRKLNLRKIEDIHRIIVEGLGVQHGIRKGLVGVVGTRYKPLDNEHQINEAVEKTVKIINGLNDCFSKALVGLAMISYIQPFEDGNKRTSRLLTNSILLADDACPLSFRSIDEGDYKKAIIIFYEQNSIRMLKQLFIQQFKFVVKNYF